MEMGFVMNIDNDEHVSVGTLPECDCCGRQFLTGGKLCRHCEPYIAAQRQALRDEILAAIGEDEVFVDIPEVDHTGKVVNVIKGNSYTPIMVGRNELRAKLRTAISTIFEGKANLQDGGKDGLI